MRFYNFIPLFLFGNLQKKKIIKKGIFQIIFFRSNGLWYLWRFPFYCRNVNNNGQHGNNLYFLSSFYCYSFRFFIRWKNWFKKNVFQKSLFYKTFKKNTFQQNNCLKRRFSQNVFLTKVFKNQLFSKTEHLEKNIFENCF